MKKLLFTAVGVAILASGFAAQLALSGNPNNSHNKVTICHATGSKTNPYVRITPDAAGVVAGHASHQDMRDIIPPFDYYDSGGKLHHFPGQNWDAEHQAIFNNGCKIPGSTSTTPTTPTTPTVTVTVPTTPTTPTVTVTVPATTVQVTTPSQTVTQTVTVTKPGKIVVRERRVVHQQIHVNAHARPKSTG